jgi:hypothetical protein
MTHYLDLGFLLCLVTKAPGSGVAWDVVRPLPQPVLITAFQAVQVENGLRKRLFQREPQAQAVAAKAWGLWEFYKREMVFALAPVPWDAAFALARTWNERATEEPPASSFILHPAIAVAVGSTHFLSFQPESRAFAAAAGLRLLPVKL